MGWSWSVEIIQHIHKSLGDEAGLPKEAMITQEKGLPTLQRLYAFYIDNFDEISCVSDTPKSKEHRHGKWQ